MATWTGSSGWGLIFCRTERTELEMGRGRLVGVGEGGEDCSDSQLSGDGWHPGDRNN